jgi:excisionase family DNA binding protein
VEKLLTCEQVAERYSVTLKTVWEWIRSKKLPAVKVGGRNYRIRPDDLEAFEKQYETTGGAIIHAEDN